MTPAAGRPEKHPGRSPAAALRRRVGEVGYLRQPFQHPSDNRPLHADSPPVNQPHLAKSPSRRLANVLLDDGGDVARRERVEIESLFDRNAVRWIGLVGHLFSLA